MSPTCDGTVSDGEEPDHFVRRQLLLSTVFTDYFGVGHVGCRTFFRDGLVGLGLFIARGGKLMKAVCGRLHPRAQWRLIDLRPGPHWTSYGGAARPRRTGDRRVGGQRTQNSTPPPHLRRNERPALRDKWDVRRPDVNPEE